MPNYKQRLDLVLPTKNIHLVGQVSQTLVDGTTFVISCLAEFGCYDLVKWRDSTVFWPLGDYQLGRWLGPAPNIGMKWICKSFRITGR